MERTTSIQVYLSDDERSAIRIAAATADLSSSAYLRDCAERLQNARRWMRAYQLVQHAPLSSLRASELLLSELSAILCGTESELDFCDPIYRDAYESFVQKADQFTVGAAVLLPV